MKPKMWREEPELFAILFILGGLLTVLLVMGLADILVRGLACR